MSVATFYLTREVSTNKYTMGTLYEPISGFRCRTLERPINKIDSTLKANYCLPIGSYRCRIDSDGLLLTLSIGAYGIFRQARFTPEKRIDKTRSGCICVGTYKDGDTLGGGSEAYDSLSELCENLIDEERVLKKSARTWVNLVIKENVKQVFVVKEPIMLKRTDWDMVDDDEEEFT